MKNIVMIIVALASIFSMNSFGQFNNNTEELSIEIFQMAHCRILERRATEEQIRTLVPQTSKRFNVKGLVHFLISSNEHYQNFVNGRQHGFIVRALFDHLLDRSPSPQETMQGIQFLSNRPVQALIDTMMNGPEYNRRWGNHLVPGHGRDGCFVRNF